MESRNRALERVMAFLALDQLSKSYGDQVAVASLSLAVEQGEFISILGPSGCGKTTTLQMIAGFVAPTSGAIFLQDKNLASVKPSQREFGMVFQSYALFPHMTVRENVGFGLEMRKVRRSEREIRIQEALELVGLREYSGRYPRRLSGGQQQRVALARALVIRPRILLLDEPLSNLDAKLRETMQIELREIHRSVGATTILVTHDQNEAMALSDRIVVMNEGKVEQIGKPYEVYERPANSFVASFLGKTNVLNGTMTDDRGFAKLKIGDGTWSCTDIVSERVQISVRPEKIEFVPSEVVDHLKGTVRTRAFLGNHWLYQIETKVGSVTVISQNKIGTNPEEGSNVGLRWRADDMSIRPADFK